MEGWLVCLFSWGLFRVGDHTVQACRRFRWLRGHRTRDPPRGSFLARRDHSLLGISPPCERRARRRPLGLAPRGHPAASGMPSRAPALALPGLPPWKTRGAGPAAGGRPEWEARARRRRFPALCGEPRGCLWCRASKLTPYASLLDASPEKPRRIIIATGLGLPALSREITALIKA